MSISALRMIRHNEGCLSCGEPVEAVLVVGNDVRPAPARPLEDGPHA